MLTLPAEICRRRHPRPTGRAGSIAERADGIIELHAELPVPAEQIWFWSQRWQSMERKADDDIAAAQVAQFDGDGDLLADLDA